MANFKKLLYDKIVTVLNDETTSGLTWDGGYDFVIYNGIPHVVDQSSGDAFNYVREEVIPVSEEYNNETPSVNASDRSDYTCQYQIFFRLQHLDEVRTALEEFRDYFYTNKQFTLDGYTVSIKTVRGNKQQSIMVEGGNIYGRYTIDVYCTATLHGYLVKDTDILKMRKKDEITTAGSFVVGQTYEIKTVGTTDYTLIGASANTVGVEFTATGVGTGTGTAYDAYKTLKLVDDTTGTQGNPLFSNATGKGKGSNELATLSSRLQVVYESDYFTKHLYSYCKNKEDEEQIYELKETFDGVDFEYDIQISGASRTLRVGGFVIMLIDWMEADA